MDTSQSIKNDQFDTLRQALADLTDNFDVGPGPKQTRIAAAGFGRSVERYFDFDDHTDKESAKNALLNIGRVKQYKATRTHLGINMMMETFAGDFGSRPDAKHISIVFTNGKSTAAKDLQKSLQTLEGTDIVQYAVGIGKGINHEELVDIAQGNPNHVFEVASFDELLAITSELSDIGCSESMQLLIVMRQFTSIRIMKFNHYY